MRRACASCPRQLPQLRRDIQMPDYCALSLDEDDESDACDEGDACDNVGAGGTDDGGAQTSERGLGGGGYAEDGVRINAWFGPAGT
eukprot:1325154-Prymnesium_polylepis.1